MNNICLEVSHLKKEFVTKKGKFLALDNLNLYVNKGEFVCIIGASGSGKSTLLRIIGGLETPTFGHVIVNDINIKGPGSDRGMVFQKYTLYPWLSVKKNVEFGLKLQGFSKKERQDIASYYIDVVGLSSFINSYPYQLSGGMQQRVAIARSLATHPQILLMDEPFGALDVQTKENMQQFLLEIWQRTQCTILMITHDIREAVFLSQRIYILTQSPGTIKKELIINLPKERNNKTKWNPTFHHYIDEIMGLLRDKETIKIS